MDDADDSRTVEAKMVTTQFLRSILKDDGLVNLGGKGFNLNAMRWEGTCWS